MIKICFNHVIPTNTRVVDLQKLEKGAKPFVNKTKFGSTLAPSSIHFPGVCIT